MRNFWFDAVVDGKKSSLSSGPRGKDQGMQLSIRQISKGESLLTVSIRCYKNPDGKLVTRIETLGQPPMEVVTEK